MAVGPRLGSFLLTLKYLQPMETALVVAAFAWTALCAVSHVRIEAKKRGESLAFADQKLGYIVQVAIYWIFTGLIV